MTDPMKVFASCVRGALIAAPGKNLISLDFAGIESRVTAWLAGEEWKLQAFRAYDEGTGPDLYKLAYSRAFRVPVESVVDKKRQVGKVMELSLGYEGGVGAFVTMTKTYGVNLNELADSTFDIIEPDIRERAERFMAKSGDQGLGARVFVTCDSLKRMWRDAHPKIVELWADIKKAALNAVVSPGKVFAIPNKRIAFCVKVRGPRSWLYMRLPSGRKLAYYMPEIDESEAVTYMGTDTKTRRWMRVPSYGGKWTENSAQAISRDLLVGGMMNMEEANYPIVMTVHDEIVAEIDEGSGSLEEASKIMCSLPKWTEGLPVTAEGWRGARYRK